jgi:hypothetical protein
MKKKVDAVFIEPSQGQLSQQRQLLGDIGLLTNYRFNKRVGFTRAFADAWDDLRAQTHQAPSWTRMVRKTRQDGEQNKKKKKALPDFGGPGGTHQMDDRPRHL